MCVVFDVLRRHKNRSQLEKKSPSCFTAAQNTQGCANYLFRGHAGHIRRVTRTRASARTLGYTAMAFCVRERQPPPSGTLYYVCLRRGRSARRPSLKWQVCPGCLLSVLLGASCAARAGFTPHHMHVCVCVCRQATVPSAVQRKHHQAAP